MAAPVSKSKMFQMPMAEDEITYSEESSPPPDLLPPLSENEPDLASQEAAMAIQQQKMRRPQISHELATSQKVYSQQQQVEKAVHDSALSSSHSASASQGMIIVYIAIGVFVIICTICLAMKLSASSSKPQVEAPEFGSDKAALMQNSDKAAPLMVDSEFDSAACASGGGGGAAIEFPLTCDLFSVKCA